MLDFTSLRTQPHNTALPQTLGLSTKSLVPDSPHLSNLAANSRVPITSSPSKVRYFARMTHRTQENAMPIIPVDYERHKGIGRWKSTGWGEHRASLSSPGMPPSHQLDLFINLEAL